MTKSGRCKAFNISDFCHSLRHSSFSAHHPEITRNNVHQPFQIGWQLAGIFLRIERHDQQIRLYRFHKIGCGKPGVATNAAHFDRHIGMAEIKNEMLQFRILIRFRRGAFLFARASSKVVISRTT